MGGSLCPSIQQSIKQPIQLSLLASMACVASTRGDSALLSRFHRGEPARTPTRCAASACGDFPLLIAVHGRKTAWAPMKRASTCRSNPAPLFRTHCRKTPRRAMERTPAQRSDFSLLFWVHGRKSPSCPRFAALPVIEIGRFILAAPAAGCPKFHSG